MTGFLTMRLKLHVYGAIRISKYIIETVMVLKSLLGQKKKYVCFLLHLEKIRVGRSLFFFLFFFNFYFFIFPDFTKKHNTTQQMRCLHKVYITKKRSLRGYLLTIQNACPTVKAFHRMNLNQNKCLNSNTASKVTAKVSKPIKHGRR